MDKTQIEILQLEYQSISIKEMCPERTNVLLKTKKKKKKREKEVRKNKSKTTTNILCYPHKKAESTQNTYILLPVNLQEKIFLKRPNTYAHKKLNKVHYRIY